VNEPKDNSGAIFVNDRKEKDSHPDRKGSAMIGGVEYWVSGWIKKNDRGPWLSLSFTPKDKLAAPAPAPRQAAKPKQKSGGGTGTGFDEMDDDIPFATSALSCDVIGNARKINRSRSAR
jgi:hypothetical protein